MALREGSVEVTGPLVGRRQVKAGERLDVKAEHELKVSTAAEPPAPPPIDAGSATANPGPVPLGVDAGEASSVESPQPRRPGATPRWLVLARARAWEQAWAELRGDTLARALERSPADELLLLADAARFSGNPARAIEVLSAVRRRFSKDPVAHEAAYLMGSVQADQLHDPDAGLIAFQQAFEGAPNGLLAEESLARALELAVRGQKPEAPALARRYLEAFPRGPHAAQALRAQRGAVP